MLLLPGVVGRLQISPHSVLWRETLVGCPNPVFTYISHKASEDTASPVPAALARQVRWQERYLGPWGQ